MSSKREVKYVGIECWGNITSIYGSDASFHRFRFFARKIVKEKSELVLINRYIVEFISFRAALNIQVPHEAIRDLEK